MKKIELTIKSTGQGMDEALKETEKLATEGGLSNKERLHLRLLAEELFGMMRSITGEIEARYSINRDDKAYTVCLESEAELTVEMRETLLSVSTSGKNEAAKGFMGKIKEIIAIATMPLEANPSSAKLGQLGLMSMGSPGGYASADKSYEWNMSTYKKAVQGETGEAAIEAWDELEKSIVANIADEVSLYIKGSTVRIEIQKAF